MRHALFSSLWIGCLALLAHTAMADIHESIDELIHYRQHLLAV
jgi:oligoribonuclease (3'-5' exoribonuclease)